MHLLDTSMTEPRQTAKNRSLPQTTLFKPRQASNHAGYSDFQTATEKNPVADEKSPEAAPQAGCRGVADEKPGHRAREKSAEPDFSGLVGNEADRLPGYDGRDIGEI
ncbi:MAG TPA: hypothetical protein ENJ86_06720 [Methylothermaceae bacterium]|nr:hypothetical protein [Methylothermaceae bacterium]